MKVLTVYKGYWLAPTNHLGVFGCSCNDYYGLLTARVITVNKATGFSDILTSSSFKTPTAGLAIMTLAVIYWTVIFQVDHHKYLRDDAHGPFVSLCLIVFQENDIPFLKAFATYGEAATF